MEGRKFTKYLIPAFQGLSFSSVVHVISINVYSRIIKCCKLCNKENSEKINDYKFVKNKYAVQCSLINFTKNNFYTRGTRNKNTRFSLVNTLTFTGT